MHKRILKDGSVVVCSLLIGIPIVGGGFVFGPCFVFCIT